MHNDQSKQSVHEAVKDAITSGRIHMKPRWRFVLTAALWASGAIIIALGLLFMVSFTIFTLRQTGLWFLPLFGLRALIVFLFSIPWLLIIFSLLFIVILEVIVRHYSFAYRRPLLYSALAILTTAILGGSVVAQTPFHDELLKQVQNNNLPSAAPLYRSFCLHKFKNVHRGTVADVTDDDFRIANPWGERVRVLVTPETRFPHGIDVSEGDIVVIFGNQDNGAIHAFGIKKINGPRELKNIGQPELHRRFRPPVF